MTGPRLASPPCLAAEIAPDYFDPLGVDPQQALDVARWRKAERARLVAERVAAGPRREDVQALAGHLEAFLHGDLHGKILAGYWPIRGEPDLRPWLADLAAQGVRVALPVVVRRHAPLAFRPWTPGAAMERGVWNIPVPATTETVHPGIVLAPLVGWDAEAYRLGHGGGYFDRTLAVLAPRPLAIGVGWQAARLATIFPQPHDIGLDAIVTEAGVQAVRSTGP